MVGEGRGEKEGESVRWKEEEGRKERLDVETLERGEWGIVGLGEKTGGFEDGDRRKEEG